MAKQLGEDTKVTLDLKTIGMAATFIVMLAGMWYTLQADIAEAKELPLPEIFSYYPVPPTITKVPVPPWPPVPLPL